MSSFKKSLNFRLNLAKSREQMLLNDHFKKFDAASIDIPEEVKQLRELLALKDQEIESLRQQVESNPVAAEKHAKIVELESKLRQTEHQNTKIQSLDQILKLTEQSLRSLADYKVDISFLQAELAEIDFKQ